MGLSGKDRKLLWGRSRNLCAFPQCRQPLSEDEVDSQTGESFSSVIGEEAHIYSASPDGPRFDPNYPSAKLETYENRILLCGVHHARVDAESGRGYDASTLLQMKSRHEQQEERRGRIREALRAYIADQYEADDKVLFRQVKLEGPRVDTMFVDVPFAARRDAGAAQFLSHIAAERPGDARVEEDFVVVGAAQALLHPEWTGNALVVGGPGQGKSTLLQYVCQFHRARFRGESDYTGEAQRLQPVTSVLRVPIRLDLRDYAQWASLPADRDKAESRTGRRQSKGTPKPTWPQLERYIGEELARHSGVRKFRREDLAALFATEPVLLALDGLDEVADLDHRDEVASEIVRAVARLKANAYDLVAIVATRPGMTKSPLWSSAEFPIFHLQRLTAGLRLQYLQRWCRVAQLDGAASVKLQRTFLDHESLPHIRDLASYPMQLAILLHLLHRRGLLPQQRTDLYKAYLETFLDREQTEDKEPLLSSQRDVIVDIHAVLGWHLQKQTEGGKGAGRISRSDLRRLLKSHLAGHEKGQELANKLFMAMESRVLCLIEREPGFFEFEVHSLREYFSAVFIDEYADPRGDGRVGCFDALLERPYWLNTCRFFVGMFSKIEVRGIRQSLNALRASGEIGLQPHLRLTAGRLLDDRVYQTQPDTTIREVVDFVLEGPGAVLAEDGFLDDSGLPLTFAEDAGRSQAIAHLQTRLLHPQPSPAGDVLAHMLRRHADAGELAAWWWDAYRASADWLRLAAVLGALEDTTLNRETALARAVASATCDTEWATEVLARGGYAGSSDAVLEVCKDDLNDGAAEVLTLGAPTPLRRLADSALAAQLRPTSNAPGAAVPRTCFRRAPGRTLLADFMRRTEQLRGQSEPTVEPAPWARRLEQVAGLWGDGWILRQAVSALPDTVDASQVARAVSVTDPPLAQLLQHEHCARTNRGEAAWWHADWDGSSGDLERRTWLFSLLTLAHTDVVISLAAEIDSAASLAPKRYRAMEAALAGASSPTLRRRLVLQDSLRRGQVSFSGRSLWLLRLVSTAGSQEQIDKRLPGLLGELLVDGMGDRRPLLRVVGQRRTVRITELRGTRHLLPGGAWAGGLRMGAFSAGTTANILQHPENWPVDIVGRAIQEASSRLGQLPALANLAENNGWFATAHAE